jgi:GT2 family glycosyltransferase
VEPKVGVALAVHNSCDQTRECLRTLFSSDYDNLYVVVVDDGSSDSTWEMLQQEFPVIVLQGDGNLWWMGATNWAVRECLKSRCEFVLLLNPDVLVQPDTVSTLVNNSVSLDSAIVTPLVLDYDAPECVWEAGHIWGPLFEKLPIIWISRYMYKHKTKVSDLPAEPYSTVSVVGRGGLIPKKAFETLGLFDEKHFPHYGADGDYAIRAWRARYPMYIIPEARVLLHTDQTSMKVPNSFKEAIHHYWRYLTSRKHGEALKVLYYLYTKNLPFYAAIPSYLFGLTLNTVRYWQSFAQGYKRA